MKFDDCTDIKAVRIEYFLIKENFHPWVKVDQANRPLPPKTLSILEGLALKTGYLCAVKICEFADVWTVNLFLLIMIVFQAWKSLFWQSDRNIWFQWKMRSK